MQPNARFGNYRALSWLFLALGLGSGCAVSQANDDKDNPFVVDPDDSTGDGEESIDADGASLTDGSDGEPGTDGSGGDGSVADGTEGGDGDGTVGDGATSDGATGDGATGDGDVGTPDAGTGPVEEDAGTSGPQCTAANCNDGVACTVDACNAADACTHTPNHSACANGGTCTATGCVAPVCAESPCKLVSPQCGCAAGQGCYPDLNYEPECASAGTGAEQAACDDSSECSAGTLCLELATNPGSGNCYKMCSVDADCTRAGSRCNLSLVDEDGLPTGIKACT